MSGWLVSASLVQGKKVGPKADEIPKISGSGRVSLGRLGTFPLRVEMCLCLYATVMPEPGFRQSAGPSDLKKPVLEHSCVQLLQIAASGA